MWPPKLDLLFFMGDLVDGQQRKSESTGLYTGNLGDQTEAIVEMFTPYKDRAKHKLRVDGTPYHEGFHKALAVFDEKMGVEDVQQVIDVQLDTGILNVAHHPIGGATIYAGTQTDREALWSRIAAYDKSVPDARWIVRAHRHDFILQETRRRTIVQTPCFQLPTPHAKKQNYWKWQPVIGGLLMVRDTMKEGGYSFYATTYDLPTIQVKTFGTESE